MSYSITVFVGDQRNVKEGQVLPLATFAELSKKFSKCAKGNKHSSYFVRGVLEPVHRKNANLKSSRIMVIDGDDGIDGSLCSPYKVHRALIGLGLNHFIYTSHSHKRGQNKFRAVVEAEEHIIYQLRAETKRLVDEVNKAGCNIKYVSEMNTWTQPWFAPTRDNPEDGMFKFYEYHKGNKWEISDEKKDTGETKETSEEQAESTTSGQVGLEEMYGNIRTGKEFHESLRNISYQYCKDGVNAANAKEMIRTLMNTSSESGSDRWQERYDDIDRLVDGAYDRIKEEFELDHVEIEPSEVMKMPRPPGLLGELYDSAYDSLLYQYEEVALVSAVGCVAGIIGRKFNVMQPKPMGLNVYMTLVAKTGTGKESIGGFIHHCLASGCDGLKPYTSFMGPSSFTGPKAITNAFEDARSRVCVVAEAGLMMQVKSGNGEGKVAMILNMYSQSHRNAFTSEQTYSDKEKSVPSLRAPALTIISESTDDALKQAYRESGALDSGYLPRQSMFMIKNMASNMNRNVQLKLSNGCKDKLNALMELASAVQSEADPKPFELYFDKSIEGDMWDFCEWCNTQRIHYVDDDHIKSTMFTRMAVKAIKYAGICHAFNCETLEISKEAWEWGKEMVHYELSNVTSALGNLGTDGVMAEAIVEIATKIVGIINDTCVNREVKHTKAYRDKKVISATSLKQYTKRLPVIKKLGEQKQFKYKQPLDRVLEYLADEGVIKLLDRDPISGKPKKMIKLLPMFNDFMKGVVE